MSFAPLRPTQTPLLNLLPQLAMKPVTGLARSWLSTSKASVHVQLIKCWGPRPYCSVSIAGQMHHFTCRVFQLPCCVT